MRVPASTYTDPALHERERREIFATTPQLLCLSADLSQPGDYATHDALGVPILAVRGADGCVRTFINACTHRAARLVDGQGSCRTGFSCPYHGWHFDTQGQLVGIHAESTFGGIERSQYSLRELPSIERHGLVFVSPLSDLPFTLEDHLGSVEEQLSSFGLADCEPVASGAYQVHANWKLSLDTFSEGYHFSTLHQDTLAKATFGNLSTFDRFGHNGEHHRLAYPARTLAGLASKPESEWGDPYQHFGFVYFLHPNVSMLISAPYVDVFRIYPGATPGEQTTLYSLYARAPLADEAAREEALAYFRFTYDVVEREDFHVTESEQRNLESGAVDELTFGRNEPALINLHHNFHRVLA
jgi:phenylpropionate dioxygenase-like ring-hydroxylating dioxygenase large terminal subunit